MACKIDRPDPQALFNRYLNMFSATVLGGAPVIPESNEWYASSINYAMAEEFYAITEQAWKELDPRYACCENLTAMAAQNGVYPRPAIFAQGYVKLSGKRNAPLPEGLEFTIGGLQFITATDALQPTQLDSTGSAVIRVRALVAGSGGNITEETGSMTTVVANVDSEVEVCGGTFCEGADAETCDQFRARYIRRLQYQPRATNQWIMDKIVEWPCATRALQRAGTCCQCSDCTGRPSGCEDCGCKDCGGKLEFYVMFDNSFDNGIAPASVVEEVEEWLFGSPQGYGLGQVEIGVCGRLVPITPVRVNVFMDILDCPSGGQLTQIENQVREFFNTLEPSKPLRAQSLEIIAANIVGATANIEVRFELVNPADGYGTGMPRTDDSKVFIGNCDLEPECDYLLVLNNLTITRPITSQTDCF